MLRFVFALITLLSTMGTGSANNTIVTGRVLNGADSQPIPFVTVVVANESNETVAGTITNEEGRFVLEDMVEGSYVINFSFVGFEAKAQSFLVGELNTVLDLGKIILKPSNEFLKEINITASKLSESISAEKKVFNIDQNIGQSGGSVLDVMKTMPGVTVDQEGKVILRGSDKVMVLMDGKQSSFTGFGNQKGLDNIPAANIEQIEVINNPSAKYDASGMAGIINIIYKKETKKGLNGEVGFAYGLGVLGKVKDDLPTDLGSYEPTPKYIPSLSLNYRADKLNFFLQSEVLRQKKLPNNEFTTRTYDDGRVTVSQVPENRTQTHYIVKGGIDWFMDDFNTLTFSGIYDWEIHVDTAQVPYIDLNTNTAYRQLNWHEEEITGYMNLAVNYKHKFQEPGHELAANLQYTKGWEDETYFLHDYSSVRQNGGDKTSILATEHTTSLSLDYIKPLYSGRIEAGTKVQIRRLPVEFTVTRGENSVIYPGLGEWSDWGEDIYAGYVNYLLEKSKYTIEAGLRAEQTKVFYNIDPDNIYYNEDDSYSYFKLFPNVRFTLKINDSNSISAFYNRRIDRPGEPELRIFAKSDDQELLKAGNPYLRPQLTESYELAYKLRWESGSFFVAGYHRNIEDPFMRVYSEDTVNTVYDVITKIYANTGSAKNTGVELIFSQRLTDFWKLNSSVNWYRNTINAYQGNLMFPYKHSFDIAETTDNTSDFKLSNLIDLPWKTQLQLTAVYYAPKNIPQGKEMSRSSVDIGFKKKMMGERAELNLSLSDAFNKFGIRQQIQADGFTALYENYYETQVLRLGFKYKF